MADNIPTPISPPTNNNEGIHSEHPLAADGGSLKSLNEHSPIAQPASQAPFAQPVADPVLQKAVDHVLYSDVRSKLYKVLRNAILIQSIDWR
jgi:hypothetical protein